MNTEKKHGIYVAEVDTDIPPWITNEFDKYTNVRKLTQGGKAVISLAKDTNLGRNVLIKRLRPELKDDSRELRRLIREARITAQLQHPGIVPVYELGRDNDGIWYFSMRRVLGSTLYEIHLKRANGDTAALEKFTLNRLLTIYVQVCDALVYAHVRGVIHRDIKPENILIGSFGEVILLDWGVAKVWGMPNEGEEDTIRERGGSPLYMSPEQVTGDRYIDERSDIFSLGVVLYEILVTKEPFRGRHIRETFENILHDAPIPPSEVAPNRMIPQRLEEICMKALQKRPEDRFQSVAELVEAIEDFLNQALMRGSI